MRHKTKSEHAQRQGKPKPPGALPKMVVDERRNHAGRQSNPEPNGLPLDEKINVAVCVPGKSAGTEKHHNADDEHCEHSQKKKMCAFSVHQPFFAFLAGMISFWPTFNLRGSSIWLAASKSS